jgi:Mycothiol maleylpyruvate isomerase N-terminal domain
MRRETTMQTRAHVLAERVEYGVRKLIAFAEGLSDAEWQTVCMNEGRTVGVLIHHVATALPLEIGAVKALAAGQAISGVTWEMVDQGNAAHASEHASCGKDETLELLKQNSTAAVEAIRTLSDEQLDQAAPISLHGDAPLTTQFFIENHPLAHAYRHLASIGRVIGSL